MAERNKDADNGETEDYSRDKDRSRRTSNRDSESSTGKDWKVLNKAQERVIRNIARQEVEEKNEDNEKEVRLNSRERRSRRKDRLFQNTGNNEAERRNDIRQRIQEEKKHLEQLKGELQKEKRRREDNRTQDDMHKDDHISQTPKTSQRQRQHDERAEREVKHADDRERHGSGGFLEGRSKIEAFLIGLGAGIILAFLIGVIVGPVVLIG